MYSIFEKLLKQHNVTAYKVAKETGVSPATISAWKNGEYTPKQDKMQKIADYFNVTVDYLLTGEQKESPPTFLLEGIKNIVPIETYKIPLLGDIACGELRYAEEDFEGYVECGANIRADFALRAVGDSMINARIMDGDIVFIRKQPMVEDGEIAAVLVGDDASLKRFYRYGDTIVLHPENPTYKDITLRVGEDSDIRILGKAIAFQSNVV